MPGHEESHMQIKKIYEMIWADSNKKTVHLVADTDTGAKENIWTPYSQESIIWDAIRVVPIEDIQPPVISDAIEVVDQNE